MFTKRNKRERKKCPTQPIYVQSIHSSFNRILFKAKRKMSCNETDVKMGQTDQRKNTKHYQSCIQTCSHMIDNVYKHRYAHAFILSPKPAMRSFL